MKKDDKKIYLGTHGGSIARVRAEEKLYVTLLWLLKNEITDVFTLCMLLRLGESAGYEHLRRLKKLGLIATVWVAGCLARIIHLTPAGERFIRPFVAGTEDETLNVGVYPSKISLKSVQHDLLAQRAAIEFLHRGSVSAIFDRQIRHRKIELGRGIPNTGLKISDFYLDRRDLDHPERYAIELQESDEDDIIIERKISQYAEAITRGDIHKFAYFSTDPAILKRLARIANSEVRAFSFNSDQKNWYTRDSLTSPFTPEIRNKRFILGNISHLAPGLYPSWKTKP